MCIKLYKNQSIEVIKYTYPSNVAEVRMGHNNKNTLYTVYATKLKSSSPVWHSKISTHSDLIARYIMPIYVHNHIIYRTSALYRSIH